MRSDRDEGHKTMTNRLRVLLIEDIEEDAALVLRQLRTAGYEPESRRVQTEDELLDALSQSEWDVVISEYKMRRFSAPDALRIVQDRVKDLPFVVVSGTVGEDVAVECMRAGAVDFLSKNRLVRLGPAVSREVLAASGRRARRSAESALRTSEASARQIVFASNEGILIVDGTLLVRYVNPAAEVMLGRTAGALVGHELPFPLCGDSNGGEASLVSATGAALTVEVRTSRIDWAGEDSTLVVLHDITMRKRVETQLKNSFVNLADTLSRAMASRDPYTTGHQQRVAGLVVQVGSRMGLNQEQLWELRLGALLHDVGKVAVPERLLTKPGRLTAEEFDIVKTHSQEGYEILRESGLPTAVALMALHHHESLDGSGYPQHLPSESLNLEDRILIASNVLESLTSFRPYRRAFEMGTAVSMLVAESGTRFDPAVVSCLTELVEKGEFVPGGR
jgi:putative nucleotidyltransferase with HDIG domain